MRIHHFPLPDVRWTDASLLDETLERYMSLADYCNWSDVAPAVSMSNSRIRSYQILMLLSMTDPSEDDGPTIDQDDTNIIFNNKETSYVQ